MGPKFKIGQRVERLRVENPPMPVINGEVIRIDYPTGRVFGTIEEVIDGFYVGTRRLGDGYFYIFRPDGVVGKMPPECSAPHHEGCFKALGSDSSVPTEHESAPESAQPLPEEKPRVQRSFKVIWG